MNRLKIAFLLDNAYGIGGTIRATATLSGALAARGHRVEVVSLRRTRDTTELPFAPEVTLTPLIDLRPDAPAYDGYNPLYHQPSERYAEGDDHPERGIATRLGDLRVQAWLQSTDADVVIGTRPKINDYLAAYGTDRYLRIGQEHLTRALHRERNRRHQDAAILCMDAFVTVSRADARHYRAALPYALAAGTVITAIPNPVAVPEVALSDGGSRLVVAAGRLVKVKRYDRLIRAFAQVAPIHPDWRLRLYGRGPQRPQLRALIDELNLADQVSLMGSAAPIESEWAKGAIAAVSSDAEAFGMTIVEALHCGVPVIATDCPYGPGEILRDHDAGLLVPVDRDEENTVAAYAEGLARLMGDAALRAKLAVRATSRAADFAPERIAIQYEELIGSLLDRLDGRRAALPAPVSGQEGSRVRSWTRTAATSLRRLVYGKPPHTGYPAHVRAAPDGSFTLALDRAELPERGGHLLLVPRHKRSAEPACLSLPPRAQMTGTTYDVTVSREQLTLPEGYWEVWLRPHGTRERRAPVTPRLIETAALLSRSSPPRDRSGALAPWIPYANREGQLIIRTWVRNWHAEVVALRPFAGFLDITARLYGPTGPLTPGWTWRLLAVARGETGSSVRLPLVDCAPGMARARLPYAVLEHAKSVWDLWLDQGEAGSRLRLARLLDDRAMRTNTDEMPLVPDSGTPGTGIRAYFTVNNALAVRRETQP